MLECLQRMARYNQWMNHKLFAKTALLSTTAICMERGAFFGSLFDTLNHIMVVDLLWLRRFAANNACKDMLAGLADFPEPATLRDVLFPDFTELTAARERLDALILDFSKQWTDALLATPIRYRDMAGKQGEHQLCPLLQNLFNHQTHHRGQVSTLLFQAGIDLGVTDLVAMLNEESGK